MMRVTLFGTRGSLPAPGPETVRYGGNTSAVEVLGSDGTALVLDAGTGIRRLGAHIASSVKRVDILLTHLHMDHIQGLGFFAPIYCPEVEVHIWGPVSSTHGLGARLSRYLSPPLFPIHLRDLPNVTCHDVPRPPFELGPFRVETALVCHPNPTVGYRIQSEGKVLAYLPDHEPALSLDAGRWREPEWTSGYDLAAGADLLIHDAQYTDEEYESRVGWGHSTPRHALEFAAHVGARKLVFVHHDPSHDDATLDRLLSDAVRQSNATCDVCNGCEGTVLEVGARNEHLSVESHSFL